VEQATGLLAEMARLRLSVALSGSLLERLAPACENIVFLN